MYLKMSWPAKLSDLYTPGSMPEVSVRSGTPLLDVKVLLHFEHGKDLNQQHCADIEEYVLNRECIYGLAISKMSTCMLGQHWHPA